MVVNSALLRHMNRDTGQQHQQIIMAYFNAVNMRFATVSVYQPFPSLLALQMLNLSEELIIARSSQKSLPFIIFHATSLAYMLDMSVCLHSMIQYYHETK